MGLKLELLRMSIYIGFPVGLFYALHQPQLYEAATVDMRRKLYPPESELNLEEYRQFVDEVDADRKKQDASYRR